MEIAVRVRDIGWNEYLQSEVQRSVQYAVDRHRSQLGRISIHLTDLNGPRGGVDKQCRITADVRGARPVTILETGDNLLAVVKRAARRLGYRVGRRVHRRRTAGAPEHRGTIRVA